MLLFQTAALRYPQAYRRIFEIAKCTNYCQYASPRAQFGNVHRFASTTSIQAYGQDRVAADGSHVAPRIYTNNGRVPPPIRESCGVVRPPGLPPAAPLVEPIAEAQLQQLVDFLQDNRNIAVLTGAGCSTESNIPDYRGPRGAYSTGFQPMTHQKFMSGAVNQRRYWARSFAGWYEFSGVSPNSCHEGIARLQRLGWLGGIITQNVDRLHHKAGATGVVELHGTTHEVICMGCGQLSCRHTFQQQLAELNPTAEEAARKLVSTSSSTIDQYQRGLKAPGIDEDAENKVLVRRPDGDVEIPVKRPDGDMELHDAAGSFRVPSCPSCGGVLKPHVVFFGDGVPKERSEKALQMAHECDGLLVLGSSLMVYSAFRLVKAAHESGSALCVVTAGPTRADEIVDIKIEALVGEVLSRLSSHPSLMIPKI